ncbi:hypothetical protein [Anaeromyxobacter paludicola]|uniref:Uncharacterized protein n=1 Tax=Anaeromyxobacter paludicola TaxID=2918171 RepID=A0ABM7X9W5_9BACT|nr:hypothetical protein [Anaeromyxobacter paludicola]BDG08641.1 hypothetical protein AMPC_17540 [Anaeromyxobacter paludicola]
MARPPAVHTLDEVIRATVQQVAASASVAIAKAVAQIAAEELEKNLALDTTPKAARRAVRAGSRARPRVEVTRWVADKRARRVPNFVIEATGCKTKKAIVAKYGDNAAFEKGKALPKAKAA